MNGYIYQQASWPHFTWAQAQVLPLLTHIRHQQGKLLGRMEALGFATQNEALLNTLTLDVIKSCEIEGDILNPALVRSSIARHLHIDIGGLLPIDRHVEGVVKMMLDATQNYQAPLTLTRLWDWHVDLFIADYKTVYSSLKIGTWRDDAAGPMQVVSGPIGRERVHFQAPRADAIEHEMQLFFDWIHEAHTDDMLLKAAIAHLWFVTIHPFDDGNGRIARAISDYFLAKSEESQHRFYSLSAQIRLERKQYYEILEKTQKGTLDITAWLMWFLQCLERAIDSTQGVIQKILYRSRFWERHADLQFNARQKKILEKLLDDFEGKLTTSKWAKMAKCSHDTALRDIQALIKYKILKKDPGAGRSTSYSLLEES